MKPLFAGLYITGLAALSFSAAAFFFAPQDEGAKIASASVSTPDNAAPSSSVAKPQTSSQTAALPNAPLSADDLQAALFGTNLGGSFDLIDHFGQTKQLEDYAGKHVMVFFGYANCLAICSAALPLMADTIDLLGDKAKADLVPLMITVDPENDTPDFMREKLAEYHPALVGMTGSEGQLADVRKKFQVRIEFVGTDIDNNPIYNHGSFIYLLGPDGKVKTLVPPILEPQQMADIMKKYILEEEAS
ncbi:MAG: SCO family protein [Hyphomicrobiales bacterium]